MEKNWFLLNYYRKSIKASKKKLLNDIPDLYTLIALKKLKDFSDDGEKIIILKKNLLSAKKYLKPKNYRL